MIELTWAATIINHIKILDVIMDLPVYVHCILFF